MLRFIPPLFFITLFFGLIYKNPDLDIVTSSVAQRCCKEDNCSLTDNFCFDNIKYLAYRCGNDWNQVFYNCSKENNSLTCVATTFVSLKDILKRCYYDTNF